MTSKNKIVSSLITASESIVGVIDRVVSFEESQLAKNSDKAENPAGTVIDHPTSPVQPSKSVAPDEAPTADEGADASQANARPMGTDISDGAGDVDWDRVKSTGITLVYCKVSGGYSNTNYNHVDSKFADYWPQLEQSNIARGAYCFFDLNFDGQTQAELFLKLINAAGGLKADDMPPCLDIEWSPSPSDAPFPTSNAWQDEALAWLAYVEAKTGRIPIIYTGLSMAQNHFDSRFSKYPLWVARYPTENPTTPTSDPYPSYAPADVGPWDTWTMWQYSENGTISGIGTGQDLDVLKGSVEDLVNETTVSGSSSSTKGKSQPDLSVTDKHARALQRNEAQPDHPGLSEDTPAAENKSFMVTVGKVSVYKTSPFPAVIYQGGLAVGADGSPFAYHPEPDSDKGLDYLANAGSPGNWWGIATKNGTPVVQGASDPAPGYYVSTTALEDPNFSSTDPRAYVNSSEIPFIVLPLNHHNFGGAMGDIGVVVNFSNGKSSYVIAADEGPPNNLGEGSVALAKALGVNSSAKSGGVSSGIAYCFFPGSGSGRPQALADINKIGGKLFSKFGGVDNLKNLLDEG